MGLIIIRTGVGKFMYVYNMVYGNKPWVQIILEMSLCQNQNQKPS